MCQCTIDKFLLSTASLQLPDLTHLRHDVLEVGQGSDVSLSHLTFVAVVNVPHFESVLAGLDNQ